ncbi:Smr/MutS family protein, partial [Phaeospirillum tilakii]
PGEPPRRPSAGAPAPRRPAAGLPTLGHGHTPGLDRRSAERLKRGEMAIDGALDLHGMTQDAAHAALDGAIERAWAAGRRMLLVVTGKGAHGDGVLRRQVPRWLNQSPLRERILGFCHARAHHGGDGALYVLIRRRRDRA